MKIEQKIKERIAQLEKWKIELRDSSSYETIEYTKQRISEYNAEICGLRWALNKITAS